MTSFGYNLLGFGSGGTGAAVPTFTSVVTFETGNAAIVSCAKLTSSTGIVCYEDGGDSNKLKMSILTGLDTASPSAGTPVDISTTNSTQIAVSRLSDTTAACVASSSGTTITIYYLSDLGGTPTPDSGTTVASSVNGMSDQSVVGMDSTTAAVCYINGTTAELKVVSSLSTSPSVSSATTIKTSANDGGYMEYLTSSTLAIMYRHTGGATVSIRRITDVTGTPTLGTEGNIITGGTAGGPLNLSAIDTTGVMASYFGASVGEVKRVTGLDGTPSIGTAYAIPASHGRHIAVAASDTKAGVMTEDTTSSHFADYHQIGTMDGTPAEVSQNTANANDGYFDVDFVLLSATSALCCYRSDGTGTPGEFFVVNNI